MKKFAFAAALAGALLATACAYPTPYQPLETRGSVTGGFTEQRIDENRWRVAFAGNTLTSRERVENYLLYRAAELTVQAGYDGFTIVERETERDVQHRVYPASPRVGFGFGRFGHWRPYWRMWGPWGPRRGWAFYDPWYDDPFWFNRYDVRRVERYEAVAEIVMFRGQRDNDPRSFDARQVMTHLGPTIELPGERR
jgi:hypothetical protein